MSGSASKTPGTRIVPAPLASDPRLRPTIIDVECGLTEEVEWHWTMTDRGRFVSGYSIVRRLPDLNEACAFAGNASVTSGRKTRSRDRIVRRRNR